MHSWQGICSLFLRMRLSLAFTSDPCLNPQSEVTDAPTLTRRIFPTWSRQVAQIEGKPFGNLFWQLNILKVIKQTRIVWPNYEHTQPSALWERGGHKVILPVLDISKQHDKPRESQKYSSPNCTEYHSLKLHSLTDSWREDGCIQTHSTSASVPLYHTSPCQHSQSLHHIKRRLCYRHLSQILLCNVTIFFLKHFLSLVTD